MGGYGSGGRNAVNNGTVEQFRSIDVMRLRREGCLNPGYIGSWRWSRDGETVANIGLRANDGGLVLNYRLRRGGAEWEDVDQRIRIQWEPCRLGGQRPWFECSVYHRGRYCGRKVANLYLVGSLFACRHCYRLAYQCQREKAWDRALRRSTKIRASVGGEPGLAAPFPDRPKGMWKRTYFRFLERDDDAAAVVNGTFLQRARQLSSWSR